MAARADGDDGGAKGAGAPDPFDAARRTPGRSVVSTAPRRTPALSAGPFWRGRRTGPPLCRGPRRPPFRLMFAVSTFPVSTHLAIAPPRAFADPSRTTRASWRKAWSSSECAGRDRMRSASWWCRFGARSWAGSARSRGVVGTRARVTGGCLTRPKLARDCAPSATSPGSNSTPMLARVVVRRPSIRLEDRPIHPRGGSAGALENLPARRPPRPGNSATGQVPGPPSPGRPGRALSPLRRPASAAHRSTSPRRNRLRTSPPLRRLRSSSAPRCTRPWPPLRTRSLPRRPRSYGCEGTAHGLERRTSTISDGLSHSRARTALLCLRQARRSLPAAPLPTHA